MAAAAVDDPRGARSIDAPPAAPCATNGAPTKDARARAAPYFAVEASAALSAASS